MAGDCSTKTSRCHFDRKLLRHCPDLKRKNDLNDRRPGFASSCSVNYPTDPGSSPARRLCFSSSFSLAYKNYSLNSSLAIGIQIFINVSMISLASNIVILDCRWQHRSRTEYAAFWLARKHFKLVQMNYWLTRKSAAIKRCVHVWWSLIAIVPRCLYLRKCFEHQDWSKPPLQNIGTARLSTQPWYSHQLGFHWTGSSVLLQYNSIYLHSNSLSL